MRSRAFARLGTVTLGAAMPLLLGVPAFAADRLDDGEVRPKSLGAGLILLYYVVIPLAGFLIVAALSALPSLLKRPRYRPGRPWTHDPLWFAGPDDPDKALGSAASGVTARGGASADW